MTRNPRQQHLYTAIRKAIQEKDKRTSLFSCMERGREKRAIRLDSLPGGTAFRKEVKAIKERCIAEQEALVAKFTRNAEDRGAKVLFARDGNECIAQVLRIAHDAGYKTVSKSKSLTTEEIELNDFMEESGLRVVETDLGELILQLVHEKPFHLVFPAIHKMANEVAEIFEKETGKPVPNDIPEIMRIVQQYLRPIFLNTDIGMTGANVGVAENGAIVIETNEGNARLVSSIGKCHICVMGMEKIVDTVEDAMMMVLAHPVSASGQMPTTYVTWMAGRTPLGDDGEARESYIIILDNGRTAMREDPVMREALHCIRCGACMNICPTYGVTGGHTFGHIYPGPIGIPWTAAVHGLEQAGNFAELCISCGLCKEICPAQIDMPTMISEVKQRDSEQHPLSRINRALIHAEDNAKIGCATAPLSNWALRNPLFRTLLEKTVGIDRRRTLPPFARKTLRHQFAARKPKDTSAQEEIQGLTQQQQARLRRKVAYFHDIFTNYNAPELGMAVVEYLEKLGCEVVLPEQKSCGYPAIGYGDLNTARDFGVYNVARLAPYVREGYEIVCTEPTATYCLRVSYPKLLPWNPHVSDVAAHSHEFFEYILDLEPDQQAAQLLAGRRFGMHCSCHQRPLGKANGAVTWLESLGAEVIRVETGTCCGMAGTFGLKTGPLGYELANAVGEPLFERFKAAEIEAIISESSVCAMHLREGTGLPVYHPLELLQLV